jgi:hypothetical protein
MGGGYALLTKASERGLANRFKHTTTHLEPFLVRQRTYSSLNDEFLQEAKPLLQQSIQLVSEVTPLLTQLSQGGLMNNLEALTATAAAAAADIQKLQVKLTIYAHPVHQHEKHFLLIVPLKSVA